jgi:hypothetical protein
MSNVRNNEISIQTNPGKYAAEKLTKIINDGTIFEQFIKQNPCLALLCCCFCLPCCLCLCAANISAQEKESLTALQEQLNKLDSGINKPRNDSGFFNSLINDASIHSTAQQVVTTIGNFLRTNSAIKEKRSALETLMSEIASAHSIQLTQQDVLLNSSSQPRYQAV